MLHVALGPIPAKHSYLANCVSAVGALFSASLHKSHPFVFLVDYMKKLSVFEIRS